MVTDKRCGVSVSIAHPSRSSGSLTQAIDTSGDAEFTIPFRGDRPPVAAAGYKILAYVTPASDTSWGASFANDARVETEMVTEPIIVGDTVKIEYVPAQVIVCPLQKLGRLPL